MENNNLKYNRKKVIIIILVSALILLIVGISPLFLTSRNNGDNNTKNKENSLGYDYPEKDRKVIETCKKSNCSYSDSEFDKVTFDIDNKEFQKKIDKINKDTEKYYNAAKKANLSSGECAAVRDTFNHRIHTNTNFNNYVNDEFASVTVQRATRDLCTNKTEVKQHENYIYDKKQKKLITQKEFKKKLNITEEEIYNSIKGALAFINEGGEKIKLQEKYDDVVVFYIFNGDLICSFYAPETNSYYTATVRANKK